MKLMRLFLTFAIAGLLLSSCDSEPPTSIGQAYGGGIIFELKDGHRLVVATEDLGELNWDEAERQCKSYRGGGFEDWYLPSQDELTQLYDVRDAVNRSLEVEGGQQMRSAPYWSSTEVGSTNASYFDFKGGRSTSYQSTNKANTGHVRAVRAF